MGTFQYNADPSMPVWENVTIMNVIHTDIKVTAHHTQLCIHPRIWKFFQRQDMVHCDELEVQCEMATIQANATFP